MKMRQTPVRAVHHLQVIRADGEVTQATLELRYQRMIVCPPIGKHKKYPKLTLPVLHAQERNPPPGRDPIVWKLLTD